MSHDRTKYEALLPHNAYVQLSRLSEDYAVGGLRMNHIRKKENSFNVILSIFNGTQIPKLSEVNRQDISSIFNGMQIPKLSEVNHQVISSIFNGTLIPKRSEVNRQVISSYYDEYTKYKLTYPYAFPRQFPREKWRKHTPCR
ncbi:hypothetical protein SK128_006322 [Halocaridina rubra]|uniref:Uncharacterized protein n=1 Tax=Halocaridina rubra TaxID=373956 RepID=A0AAN8XH35_HALRR